MMQNSTIDTMYLFRQIQPNKVFGKINDQELVKGSDGRNRLPNEVAKRQRFVRTVINSVAFKYLTPQAAKSLEDIKPLVLGENSLGRMIVDYTSDRLRLVDACRIAYATANNKEVETKRNRHMVQFSHINGMEKQLLGYMIKYHYDPSIMGKINREGELKPSDKVVLTTKEKQGRQRLVTKLMRKTSNRELNSYEFLSLSGIKGLQFNNVNRDEGRGYYIERFIGHEISMVDAYRILRVYNEGIKPPRPSNQVWV